MTVKLNDTSFWDGASEYQRTAQAFTSHYAERAWAEAALPAGAEVLDIAAGTGALALVAARAGARVTATDFSPAMVESVLSHGLPNLHARVMDGQALDLPDASFDAAFSMFGIMLFLDWRRGLAEMARVVRPGGLGVVGTWKEPAGAAANLLLAERVAGLFPELDLPMPVEGMNELRDLDRFRTAMTAVGFGSVSIIEVTNDFIVDEATLADPQRLFQFSPVWPLLDEEQRSAALASIKAALATRDGVLPVPSPALIAKARRA